MKMLFIVRRYGPVGGMERYVWELTRELHELGHDIEVLCEVCLAEKPNGIAVHELGAIAPRPRWLSLLRFGRRAASWLGAHPHPGWLIHSHERVDVHHVTTFHGPPFASVFEKPFWRLLSIRVLMQLYLERRELSRPLYIVPNSQVIGKQLAHYYPQLACKLTAPVVPGVQLGVLRSPRTAPAGGGIIGFVGKEWRRKGLPLAVETVACLRKRRPDIELWVIGPQPEEIQPLFNGWQGGYRLLGWSEQSHYTEFDVLLHPARSEPYGMVISEAMAACVPVVVSDACGAAAQITPDAGAVVPLDAPCERWADEVEKQLRRSDAPPQFARGWSDVAREYETIYRRIFENNLR
jgi:UDP-glucose:(heptosyl)LPS alpha-1,3-glucosyltransferase